MIAYKKTFTYDIEVEKRNILRKRINSLFLFCFLSFIILTIILNFVGALLLDFGYWNGSFHLTYYEEPSEKGNHPYYLNPYYDIPQDHWKYYGLSTNDLIWTKWNARLTRQPNIFWSITQFTWLTTFCVLLTIIFRFFKFESLMPKKLRWIISHDTLYFITVMDTVVMVVFWSALLKSFNKSFDDDDIIRYVRMMSTIMVHAIVPISLIIYTIIFAIYDKDIDQLNKKFFMFGTIVNISYITYYILVSFAWDDPYAPFTHLRDGYGWWQLGIAIPFMELVIFGGYYFHNFFISKFNSHYIKKKNMYHKKINC